MPIKKNLQKLRPRLALSDSDSDDEICVNLTRYQEAELGQALHTRYSGEHLHARSVPDVTEPVSLCRTNFKRAVEELTALVKQAYAQHADKTIQELIFADVLLAIRLCCRSVQLLC